jgi:hypothetical protein
MCSLGGIGKVGNRVSGQRLLGNMFHFSTTNHMMSGKKIWTMRKLNMRYHDMQKPYFK